MGKRKKAEEPQDGYESGDEESTDEQKGGEQMMDELENFSLPSDLPSLDWPTVILGENDKPDCTITLFGKRNTGKSFYARYLLYQMKDIFPWGWVMTRTPHNGWWQQMVPEKRIYKGWRPDLTKQIIKMQEKRIRNPAINPFVFIILDDIVSDTALRYDPDLRQLYYEGRHFGIFILICSQYVYGLPPGNRANTDFMITFTQHQRKQIQQLQEDYCTEYKNWQHLLVDMDRLLGDFECLVVNQRDPNLRGPERYYKDKAKEVPPFRLGTKQYWEGSDWEQQCKDWAPMKVRKRAELERLKHEMDWSHTIDDSSFDKMTFDDNDMGLIEKIIGYGGQIPAYF